MATRTETTVVYAAGAAQGIVLVTFPAASTIFTAPDEYGLSSTQYGTMFLPQVVTAITASLAGARLGARVGIKRVYLAGLAASLVSMALLIVSQFFTAEKSVAYGLLLLATASLGVGFGLTVPALNTLTAAFHPRAVDSSVLVLNALLGLGTTLAPVFVAVFVGLGFWWGLPVTSTILLTALLLVSLRLPLQAGARKAADGQAKSGIPTRFWVYALFAVLYGICETVNGNWAQLDMTSELGASVTQASLALTAFWGMVTVGRVLLAAVQRWFPSPMGLPPAAPAAHRNLCDHRAASGRRACPGRRGVRACRLRLLRAAATHDQLRPRGAHHRRGRRVGRRHRLLPTRLWHSRLRRRPAPSGRRQPAYDLRLHGRHRRGHERGVVGCRPFPAQSGLPAPTAESGLPTRTAGRKYLSGSLTGPRPAVDCPRRSRRTGRASEGPDTARLYVRPGRDEHVAGRRAGGGARRSEEENDTSRSNRVTRCRYSCSRSRRRCIPPCWPRW